MSNVKIDTKSINLIFIFDGEVLSETKNDITKLREKIIAIWGGEVDPVITQFPEVVAAHLPQQQFSLIVERTRVLFVNQDVKPFATRDEEIEKLLKFAIAFNEMVNVKLRVYGFNYMVELKNSSKTEFKKVLRGVFPQAKLKAFDFKSRDLLAAGFNLTYKYKGQRVTVKLTPNLDFPDRLNVELNVHFDNDTFMSFDELKPMYVDYYNDLLGKIDKFFK